MKAGPDAASLYAAALAETCARVVGESTGAWWEGPEVELQARWFAGEFGRDFHTIEGLPVRILSFGRWNREAGPDFSGVRIELDGVERHGHLELDLQAAGWERHGHAVNPAYEDVVLHVYVRRSNSRAFARTASRRAVPQVCLEQSLPGGEPVSGSPASPLLSCNRAPLRDLAGADRAALLVEAARRRIEAKCLTLRRLAEAHGDDEALFQGVAEVLGYRQNRLPFRLLAQRVTLARARGEDGPALLFGVAGFLELRDPPEAEGRVVMRELWERWWRLRAANAALILPAGLWHSVGVRPANHPVRRVAALAALAGKWTEVRRAMEAGDRRQLASVLESLEDPYWELRASWQSRPWPRPAALLGAARVAGLTANLLLPWLRFRGRELPPDWTSWPGGELSGRLRGIGQRLCGGRLPRSPGGLVVQQGLLQLDVDFCRRAGDDCTRCGLPALARAWAVGRA